MFNVEVSASESLAISKDLFVKLPYNFIYHGGKHAVTKPDECFLFLFLTPFAYGDSYKHTSVIIFT